MLEQSTRRDFLGRSAQLSAGIALVGMTASQMQAEDKKEPLFKISCTQYSLHRMMDKKELDNLDYAEFVKKNFDIDAIEYWNRPFFEMAEDKKFIGELKQRADDAGVKATAILIDGEGALGDADEAKRMEAVDRHKKWVVCAKQLGCHSIRVNAQSAGTYEEQLGRAADGLRRLCEFGAEHDMNVIVENHGGLSSNGKWLSSVMKKVDLKNCGTLPDFGNFGDYDRYLGVEELMPFAKLVSAKSHDFDEAGNETRTDYLKMMKIVVDAGYNDYVGIEYEGGKIGEVEGVKATKKLLERVRDQLAKS